MTHFITKEEIEQIIELTERMDGIPGWVKEVRPIADKRMKLIKKILDRQDILEILENTLWGELQSCGISKEVADGIFINVRSKGKLEGWL